MSIQPTGTVSPALTAPVAGETAKYRAPAPPAEGAPPPGKIQTPQAAAQAKQPNDISRDASAKEKLERHLDKINKFVQARASNVQFSLDDDTGIRIVKVIDTSTKEVIRQIPTEEAVHIAKVLDQLQGLLIRQKA